MTFYISVFSQFSFGTFLNLASHLTGNGLLVLGLIEITRDYRLAVSVFTRLNQFYGFWKAEGHFPCHFSYLGTVTEARKFKMSRYFS